MKLVKNQYAIKSMIKMSGNRYYVMDDLYVLIPKRYEKIKLMKIGEKITYYGIAAIVAPNGDYGLLNINSMVDTVPSSMIEIKVGDDVFYKLMYSKGNELFTDNKVLADEYTLSVLIDELYVKVNIPFYMTYDDLGKVLGTAFEHSRSNIAMNIEIFEFLASIVTRVSGKKDILYRKNTKAKHTHVPLTSRYYNTPGALNKIGGARFDDGIKKLLVTPNNVNSDLENILRK